MLQVQRLNASYGRAHILFDVSISVGSGEVVVLLGRNGAGKTTTLKSIMGLVPPDRGSITFLGQPIHGLPPHDIARMGLGYVPEDRRLFTELTVMENLEVGRQAPREGAPLWSPERVFGLFPSLGEIRERLGGQMSGGEQQMLSIARTLMGNPRAVLLDEPSEGLAPVLVEQMARTIRALKGEGLSVLLSEQNLHFATRMSDRAYVIEKGAIRYQGTMAQLMENQEIRSAYLTL